MYFHPDFDRENIEKIGLWFYAIPKTVEIGEGLSFGIIDKELDLLKHHQMLWKGFDHKEELPTDEKTMKAQKQMLSAVHMNSWLHVVAKNEEKTILELVRKLPLVKHSFKEEKVMGELKEMIKKEDMGWSENGIDGKIDLLLPIKLK